MVVLKRQEAKLEMAKQKILRFPLSVTRMERIRNGHQKENSG